MSISAKAYQIPPDYMAAMDEDLSELKYLKWGVCVITLSSAAEHGTAATLRKAI